MEHIWQTCLYDKLRCNPRDHYVLLTEPPLNTPENRERAAEIMFETFNVPGMCISVQAVLALAAASWTTTGIDGVGTGRGGRELTGTVIDSGYGSTHIVPVADGHVMSSGIQQIDVGGRDVTAYVQGLMRERKEPIPHGIRLDVARKVKEMYSYTCPDIQKEFQRYDSNPQKFIKRYEDVHRMTGKKWACTVGYERFMAPEVVLNPQVRTYTAWRIDYSFTRLVSSTNYNQFISEIIMRCICNILQF